MARATTRPVDRDVVFEPVALATECVVPTLVALRRTAVRLTGEVRDDRRSRNRRWMYFLAFAGILGGKLAGATVKLAALDDRSATETRRVRALWHRGAAGMRHATDRIMAWIGRRREPPADWSE